MPPPTSGDVEHCWGCPHTQGAVFAARFATRRVWAQLWRRCAAATPEPASNPCQHAPLRAMQMKAAAFQFLHAAQQPYILHVMLHVAGGEEAAHRPIHVLCWLRAKHR